jgi:SPX domain protein involved in polyphosphate accumulation
MKFGRYLEQNKEEKWADQYIDYGKLKKILKQLGEQMMNVPSDWEAVSLSTAPPTNAAAMPSGQTVTENDFFKQLDSDMEKVQLFTKSQVEEIRKALRNADKSLSASSEGVPIGLQEQVDAIGNHFLQLEKYVNLNFTG